MAGRGREKVELEVVLWMICQNPGQSYSFWISSIRDQWPVSQTTAENSIKELYKGCVVEARKDDPKDRRRSLLYPTEKGIAQSAKGLSPVINLRRTLKDEDRIAMGGFVGKPYRVMTIQDFPVPFTKEAWDAYERGVLGVCPDPQGRHRNWDLGRHLQRAHGDKPFCGWGCTKVPLMMHPLAPVIDPAEQESGPRLDNSADCERGDNQMAAESMQADELWRNQQLANDLYQRALKDREDEKARMMSPSH